MIRLLLLSISLGLLLGVWGDCYKHNPRGSNNRLNEQSAERWNAQRMFDSQNNNRGGYNVGERSATPFSATAPYSAPSTTFSYADQTTNTQYQMAYFEGSQLSVEWTNQHGCGGNEGTDPYKLNCNILLQYMCETDGSTLATDPDLRAILSVTLRDGGNTNTPTAPASYSDLSTLPASNAQNQFGHHESEAFYFYCRQRYRNFGLFHADQNLQGDTSLYTRQNPNGEQHGLECPEERDYYPYWSPSPWVDIAYLTDHIELCPLVAAGTQNQNPVGYCAGLLQSNTKHVPITQAACNSSGGTWVVIQKALPGPACQQVDWSRVNHLGNGRFGQPLTYNWTLPSYKSLLDAGATETSPGYIKCVSRIRYNISTDDYDPWNTNSSRDANPQNAVISPVNQNPTVDVGLSSLQGLKLAINTAQFGRTFQDRSHVFYIVQRPTTLVGKNVWNVNVRGKRANIVEAYPAVEYDFVPNHLHLSGGDVVHLQWTGSNTHNNGEPAGDGQAGDAGEGTEGTDRHNLVFTSNSSTNYPLALDKTTPQGASWSVDFDIYRPFTGTVIPWLDASVIAATSGQFQSAASVTATSTFNPLLNDAPASLVQGLLLEVRSSTNGKVITYMCTRNNNFSNRSEKGTFVIAPTA